MSEFLEPEATKQVIDFQINTGNVLNIESFFDKKGNVVPPEGVKKAYLIFILESRKLSRIELESVFDYDTGLVYGAYKKAAGKGKDDKKELKRWPITSVTTEINLLTQDGKDFFAMCCMNRLVAGTRNQVAKPYFRLEIPEIRAAEEGKQLDDLEEAMNFVSGLSEDQMDDLAVLLRITNFGNESKLQKKTILRKFVMNNPTLVVNAKNNKDAANIIIFNRALAANVIKNQHGVFRWADYSLGTTEEQCISWFEQNGELFNTLLNDVNRKTKK